MPKYGTFTMMLTDYSEIQARTRYIGGQSTIRNTGYVTVTGNMYKMKTATDITTVDGITRLISQDIFKDRYMHVICLSMYDEHDNMRYIEIEQMENTMTLIDDAYTRRVPVLTINIIPYQIYKNRELGEKEASDAADIFRKYGYIDISEQSYGGMYIPKYVLVKFNDIGCVPFTAKNREWG